MQKLLLSRIDRLLEAHNRAVLAIDGQSAAGKTTLASLLAERYDARVFHADDYFPLPGKKPADVNLDMDRFAEEVITPVQESRDAYSRRYDCKSGRLLPPRRLPFAPLSIIEGAYCLHPSFGAYYDLAIFLQVEPDVQRARLQARYDSARFQRAMEEWVPQENAYFCMLNIREKCDFILTMA